MKRHLIWFFLVACTAVWAQQTNPIAKAMENYDYQLAIDLIDKQPPTAPLMLTKARALKGLYRYEDAYETMQNLAEQTPDNPQTLLELAECAKLSAKLPDALAAYEKVLALNPAHNYARIQYINMLFSLDRYSDALAPCEQFLEADSMPIAMRLMAQCQEGMMQTLAARDWYKRIVDGDPYDYFAVSKLASLYIQTSDLLQAVKVTEKFREKDKENIYVNRQNAQAFCLMADYDSAADRYTELLNAGDSTRMTCYYAGVSFFAKERFIESSECLKKAHAYEPDNVNILYYLGKACSRTIYKEEGIDYMKKALELTIPSNENLAKLYAGMAECYKNAYDWKNYIANAKIQLKYEPDKHVLLYRIGAAYQDMMKDDKNAERYLEMYLKTKPENAEAEKPAMQGGELVLGDAAVYRAAESRLKNLREERFFKEGEKEKE